MEARCQCGAVSFKTPTARPLALYICHCHDCRRQSSSAFGTSAIFPRFPLPDDALMSCYTSPTDPSLSVKGGCLEGLDWRKAIHIWTKTAMVPIPEGSESHSEEADFTDYGSSQAELDQPELLRGNGGDGSLDNLP
ncbi:hypothetical protein Sste5346_004520 [Sporothrix stenoceras]|uniref:CENP-V/GFA domain-containing protein n=1 Tax=Sporothrix stenoceras TaxID=5173 RepID=A0ABR3Z888_9PEZI